MNENNKGTFTHLHVHTDYSLLDSMGKIEDYVSKAKEYGMNAIAFTDHGTMAALVSAYDVCQKAGIHFIGGFEAYVAPDGRSRHDKNFKKGESAYDHLVILFKNETGYRNGCKLLTRSNTEGFYHKPRIDFELLRKCKEGLIVLSACLAGAVPKALLKKDMEEAEKLVQKYKAVFGDDYYLELQDHGIAHERTVITGLMHLAQKFNIKLVATNDCHYVNKDDKEAHDWLLCIQTEKKLNEPRMQYEGYYHLCSQEEMEELFPYCLEAVTNTSEVAEKCQFSFEYGHYRMPEVRIPATYNGDYNQYFEDEVWKGFEDRYPIGHPKREQAKTDIEYELDIIKKMGYTEYFIDTRKTILWAKDHNILVGPGRGSGAGSRICYCLGITDIDPIPYNLLFERFLNPERISMPDIDVDYEYAYKDDVIASEAASNGKDRFAKIRTYNPMLAKSVLKSCAKVSAIPDHVKIGNKLASFIQNSHTLQEEWESNEELRDYVRSNSLLEHIWDISLKLEGVKKSASTHACGHIPTPVPCEELFPCGLDKETGYLVCEYDMEQAEHLGNLKKDLLMLRNLTIINSSQKQVEERYGVKIPLWNEAILNDKEALDLISRGDTDGVFQLESDGMKKFMMELKPTCFEDIIAGVALYRPGPMEFIPNYIEGKRHPESIHYLVPELEDILAPTYGVIVFQEQVMQIVQKLAGFSMGRADVVRKAMGKKKQSIMDEEKPHFIYGDANLNIDGCVARGITESVAGEIWEQMVDFAKYAFNKSHAASYAAITMQTAYDKAHYPIEFAAGLFTSVMDKAEQLSKYIGSFRKNGIVILPPDVRYSEAAFKIENENSIRFGLLALKGVGKDIVNSIISERTEVPFSSFEDFIVRSSSASSDVLKAFIKSGSLDWSGYTRKTMMENLDYLMKSIRKEQGSKDPNQLSIFDFMEGDFSPSYDLKTYPEFSDIQLCKDEIDTAGVYFTGHPASAIRPLLKMFQSKFIKDFSSEPGIKDGESVLVGGFITEVTTFLSQKGTPTGIINLEDETGTVKVLLFNETLGKCRKLLKKYSLLLIRGKVSVRDEEISIIANAACSLDNHPKILWITTTDNDPTEFLKLVEDFASTAEGIGDFIYAASKKTKQVWKLSKLVKITEDSVARAKMEFGTDAVYLTEKTIRSTPA